MAPPIEWGAPWPLEKLVPMDKVQEQMASLPQAAWAVERRSINGKIVNVYKNMPPNMRTIWAMLASVAFAHRPYITYLDRTYTYGEIHKQVLALVRYLRSDACQVRLGDRVAVIARNLPEFIAAHWATHLCGAVFVPINAFGTPDVMRFCVQDVDARVVICDAQRYELLAKENGLERLLACRGALLQNGTKGAGTRPQLQKVVVIPRGGPDASGNDAIPRGSRPWAEDDADGCVDYEAVIEGHASAALADWEEHSGQNIPQAGPEDFCTILFSECGVKIGIAAWRV